jgi:hypothetical protein
MPRRASGDYSQRYIKTLDPCEFKKILEQAIKRLETPEEGWIEQAILFSWSKRDAGLIFIGNARSDVFVGLAKALENVTSLQVNYLYYSKSEFQKRLSSKDPFLVRAVESPIWFLHE